MQIKLVELLLWCLVAVALIIGRFILIDGIYIPNDGYQYLNAASNILDGNIAQTSIIHFNVERTWQTIPAPLTTFQPGYPLLIAAISLLGIELEVSALLISAASTVFLIPLLCLFANHFKLSRLTVRILILFLLANSWVSLYSLETHTEALFTLVSFASIGLLMIVLQEYENNKQRPGLLILAYVLIGVSFWIRYAGLFLYVSILLYLIAFLYVHRDAFFKRALVLFIIPTILIGIGLARNSLLVGTWKGRFDKEISHSILKVIFDFVASLHNLIFGHLAFSMYWFAFIEVVLVVSLSLLVMDRFKKIIKVANDKHQARLNHAILLLGGYIFIYCGAMFYSYMTVAMSHTSRMFYPLLPCILLLGGILSNLDVRPIAKPGNKNRYLLATISSLLIGVYFVANSYMYYEKPKQEHHELAYQMLNSKMPSGEVANDWITLNIPQNSVITANKGQATAYLLKRKTLSLISSSYIDFQWDENTLKTMMETYGSKYLILYLDHNKVVKDTPFLNELSKGLVPDWLKVEISNSDVIIFKALT